MNGEGYAFDPPLGPAPRRRGVKVVSSEKHDQRAGVQQLPCVRIESPAVTPFEQPFRIDGQHSGTAVACRTPRHGVLMKGESSHGREVEVPLHDPSRVFRADMDARAPV